jgi:hypothetical protein
MADAILINAKENYVLPKNETDFALSLFESMTSETNRLTNSLMDGYKKERDILKEENESLRLYIAYVHECISLHTIPQKRRYFEEYILAEWGWNR